MRKLTPFLRAWTKTFPSTERAKRIPSGFSSVTIYSFKFILKGETEDEDITEIRRYWSRFTAELAVNCPLFKHNSTPQNDEKITHLWNFSEEEEEEKLPTNEQWLKTLQFGTCSEHISPMISQIQTIMWLIDYISILAKWNGSRSTILCIEIGEGSRDMEMEMEEADCERLAKWCRWLELRVERQRPLRTLPATPRETLETPHPRAYLLYLVQLSLWRYVQILTNLNYMR